MSMPNDKKTFMGMGGEPAVQLTEYDITSSANDFNVLTIINFIESGHGPRRYSPYRKGLCQPPAATCRIVVFHSPFMAFGEGTNQSRH